MSAIYIHSINAFRNLSNLYAIVVINCEGFRIQTWVFINRLLATYCLSIHEQYTAVLSCRYIFYKTNIYYYSCKLLITYMQHRTEIFSNSSCNLYDKNSNTLFTANRVSKTFFFCFVALQRLAF